MCLMSCDDIADCSDESRIPSALLQDGSQHESSSCLALCSGNSVYGKFLLGMLVEIGAQIGKMHMRVIYLDDA